MEEPHFYSQKLAESFGCLLGVGERGAKGEYTQETNQERNGGEKKAS
jgi:hypothetical protein